MNIPKYKCHKEVQALKIDGVLKSTKSTVEKNGFEVRLIFEGEESIDVPFEWAKKHEPAAGGYYVKYADGYESFSPAEAFEEGYSLVENETDVVHPEISEEQVAIEQERALEKLADRIIDYTNRKVTESNDDEYFRGFVAGQLQMCEEFGSKELATKVETLLHHESRIWVLQNLGAIRSETSGSVSNYFSGEQSISNDFSQGNGVVVMNCTTEQLKEAQEEIYATGIKTAPWSAIMLDQYSSLCIESGCIRGIDLRYLSQDIVNETEEYILLKSNITLYKSWNKERFLAECKTEMERFNFSKDMDSYVSNDISAGKEESNEEQPEYGPAPKELQPNERPQYQSTKTVFAIKIKTIDFNDDGTAEITAVESNVEPFTVNQGFIESQHPGEGGYHVITQEGQHLFYAAEWFEKNYKPVGGFHYNSEEKVPEPFNPDNDIYNLD